MMPLVAVVLWALLEAISVVGPKYPPEAVAGGTVVAVVHVSGGAVVRVNIRQGDAPFAETARTALSGWRFRAGENGDILVVFNFRTPQLYPVGSPSRTLDRKEVSAGLPYPHTVVESLYPANSLGEGSVVMRLEIDPTGAVSNARAILSLGDLTAPSIAAVRKWKFAPAQSGAGRASKAYAYAVCVFRRPVLAP